MLDLLPVVQDEAKGMREQRADLLLAAGFLRHDALTGWELERMKRKQWQDSQRMSQSSIRGKSTHL